MTEELFNLSEQYDQMLRQGIDLSGERQEYFIAGRIRDLKSRFPSDWRPRRILDFGCGIGKTSQYLAEVFPDSTVVGVDIAEEALNYARRTHGSSRLSFDVLSKLPEMEKFDLCHVTGVFHHIQPKDRSGAVTMILDALAAGGVLALFENNPWNPGTRMVMSRIPFDRDAIPLPPPEARRLVASGGFRMLGGMRFLFYYPKMLSALRFSEPWLVRVPLGAQYYVLAVRP